MQNQVVKKVVIAGGGAAGWIAAATLSKLLGPLLDITLVESDDIGIVGVGEATIPTFTTFHHLLGIDEQEFMRATQATFKLGISFEDWGKLGDRYIHSFGQVGKPTWMGDFQHMWLQAKAEGFGGDLEDYCFELQAAKANKFATSKNANINYAYHLDARLYAKFLRTFSEANGVTRIEGKIIEAPQDPETGFIQALVLESGQRIEGDLFLDCTGFRGLLLEQTLKTGYEEWGHWLPTDRALAVQTRSVADPLPYTRSMAHEAGWQWQIPLQHRVGNGLVWCSEHMSDDEARAKLLSNIDGETLTEPLLIKYRTGRRRKVWNKNCVGLGLAIGFVEPLESTAIHLIQVSMTRLVQMFPFSGITEAMASRFNEMTVNELEQIRDFIILHYKLNDRNDSPFWNQAKAMDVPESLTRRMDLFRENAFAYQGADELFRVDSWIQVMLGQGLEPQGHHLMGRLMAPEQLRMALGGIKTNIAKAVASMPSHQEFLNHYCSAAKN